MRKLLIIPAALLLVALLFFIFIGDGDDRPPADLKTAAADGTAGDAETHPSAVLEETPHHGLATVHCALEVNGARFRELGSGTPLYVKVIVTNPLDTEALPIEALHERPPLFTIAGDDPVAPATAPLSHPAERVPAGGTAVLTWILEEPLAPGRYDVTIASPPDFAGVPGIDRVRVKTALLHIFADPAPEGEVTWHRRQIMAARGENEMLIADISADLERSPDDLALRRELVDALERTGDFTAAREELLELGFRAQVRQQAGDEEAPVHLPAWILTRDRLLLERARRTGE